MRSFSLVLLAALLSACMTDPRQRAIGQAYVGPETLPMRKELSTRAEIAATLKHGERLELLQFRRRFVKVRNLGGAEGWVDSRSLLTDEQVDELRRLSEMAAALPSQGKATAFDVLNVHATPNRLAPSPWQIFPGTNVDVLGHLVARRVPYRSPVTELAVKKPLPRKPKRSQKKAGQPEPEPEQTTITPPPWPPAPKLPEDWQRLSRVGTAEGSLAKEADDWTLVRSSDRKTGYVLTRNLLMGIPDNLGRYAGGHRIMAYFTLGAVQDGAESKPHWFWATCANRLQEYQFDSFRVFAYNLRRHRYETVFWEKNVRGYYPITAETLQLVEKQQVLTIPGFRVLTADADGTRWKRTYGFHGSRVRLMKKEPAAPAVPAPRSGSVLSSSLPPLPPPEGSIVNRVKELLKK
ncbi:MAG: SH3 domain-containing protein [Bryobacteraceae bacterium]|nr:SH3 domain-containing protein [Bryobacteraceae bacterium]